MRADDFAGFIPLAETKVGLLPPAELSEEQVAQLRHRRAEDVLHA